MSNINILSYIEPEPKIKGFYIVKNLIVDSSKDYSNRLNDDKWSNVYSIVGVEIYNVYTKDTKYVTVELALEYLDYHSGMVDLLKEYRYVGYFTYWKIIDIYETLGGTKFSVDTLYYNVGIIDKNNKTLGTVINNYTDKSCLFFKNNDSFLSVCYVIETMEFNLVASSNYYLRYIDVLEDTQSKQVMIDINDISDSKIISVYVDTDIDCMFEFLFKKEGNFVKIGDYTYVLVDSPKYYLDVPRDCRALFLSKGYLTDLSYIVLHNKIEVTCLLENINKINHKKNYYGLDAIRGCRVAKNREYIKNLDVILDGSLKIKNFRDIFSFLSNSFISDIKYLGDELVRLGNDGVNIKVLGQILWK